MRINFISPQFYPAVSYGGPVFSTLNTARELVKQGNEIHVSTTNANWDTHLDTPTKQDVELEKNILVHYYHDTILNRMSFPMFFGLYSDIKNSDIVFIQYIFSLSTPISLFFARWHNKPVLLSPRGSLADWILNNGKRKTEWLKFLIKPFAKSIHWHATALQEEEDILRQFPKAKIHVLPNCLPLEDYAVYNKLTKEQFVNQFLPHQHISPPYHIIVSMGRLQKKKGFDILIESFAKVKNNFPHSILVIAGRNENELENLIKIAEGMGIRESVFFCGQLSGQDKIDFLSNADVFALPSHNENFGNVYAEALACGIPIVASTTTPWREVETEHCGKWVPNTPKATAAAIEELLLNGKDYYALQCRKFVKKFSGEYVGQGFNQIAKAMILNNKG